MTDSRELVPLVVADRVTTSIWNGIRVRPRTVLVAAALAVVTIGLAMNWGALVAAGLAPLLISALPCAVMCALGLCMSRMGKSSCASETAPQQSAGATPLQASCAPEEMGGSQLAFDLGRLSDHQAAGADDTQQEQERRPVNA